MDGEYEKGQRLFVETENETVEGEFHTMDASHKVITLKNCVLHPSGQAVEGINRYYKNEIKSIRVLDPVPTFAVNKDCEGAGNWDLMRKSQVSQKKTSAKVTPAQVVMNYIPMCNQTGGRKPKLTAAEYDEANKHIKNNVLIERKGKFFMEAIDIIKAEHCVGVSFEGSALGRNNPVTLMCISTPQRTFVFDIQGMGDQAFEKELKNILQSNKIEKVIHNCSLVSDCLYHQHGVTLNKVFDTQVADLVITKATKGDFPKYARSLPRCMASYLNLPEGFIYQHKVRQGYVGVDLSVWRERPLRYELQKGIVKNTVFLLPLREKLLSKMLCTFFQGVNIFLNFIKNAEPEIAHDHMAKGALVPRELLALREEDDDDYYYDADQTATRNGFSNLKL